MINFKLGDRVLRIENVVFDLNGTLAVDGRVSERVKELLEKLSEKARIYIITSDTFGTAGKLDLPAEIVVLDAARSASVQKKEWIEKLGPEKTAAVGNGFNDHLMLKEAAIGVCVLGEEGACSLSLEAADLVVRSPEDAVLLFLSPKRIVATLRD